MFDDSALTDIRHSLHKFSLKLTHNPSDADDLLQSTLLRALEKKELFENGTNLFRWSSRIMFRLFVTEHRRKARFETQYDPQDWIEGLHDAPRQENITDLSLTQSALCRLSREQQEIITMTCLHGMKYGEVARTLRIPVGTIRSRLARARHALHIILCNDNSGYKNPPLQRRVI